MGVWYYLWEAHSPRGTPYPARVLCDAIRILCLRNKRSAVEQQRTLEHERSEFVCERDRRELARKTTAIRARLQGAFVIANSMSYKQATCKLAYSKYYIDPERGSVATERGKFCVIISSSYDFI